MSSDLNSARLPWSSFLQAQQLPEDYRVTAQQWFLPLVETIAEQSRSQDTPLLVGVNGCQGSGKSTLAAFLEMALPELLGLSVCVLSIDDFYLTQAERRHLAETIHPLLQTRGVPGTHDVSLLRDVLQSLSAGNAPVEKPRLDKAIDDRGESQWIMRPVDVVVLEGGCIGIGSAPASETTDPINELENHEDHDGRWRRYENPAN